jgi:hypothetical protein
MSSRQTPARALVALVVAALWATLPGSSLAEPQEHHREPTSSGASVPAHAAHPRWEILRRAPEAIVDALGAAELERWLAGADPATVHLRDGRPLHELLQELGLGLTIAWFTVDVGGGSSSGGSLRVRGTAGQPEPGTPGLAAELRLTGGFWVAAALALLFADGFESGDWGAWSDAQP